MDCGSTRQLWRNAYRLVFFLTLLSLLLPGCGGSSDSGKKEIVTHENLLLHCSGDCASVADQINRAGGTVYKTYANINALAANVPSNVLRSIELSGQIKTASKDTLVSTPSPRHNINLKNVVGSKLVKTVNLNTSYIRNYFPALPKNYNFNNSLTGATELHSMDITGKGVIVAVIDTGTANNAEIVPALDGTVIGGENFVDFPDEPSATSTLNDSHGTMVGTMIAGHLGIVIPSDTDLIKSIQTHAPDSVLPFSETESLLPMMGSAPESSIYAMKVFAAEGEGTPSSIVLAAMDKALTLKRNFNKGMPSEPVSGDGSEDDPFVYDSLNIQVVNMSLGGPTMFPGHELEDILALEMLKEGITIVTAAGNEGFGAMTGGSPGTSTGSLNVGAANTAEHERILRDLQFGLGTGVVFRPTNHTQIAPFSSRGPTADGRQGLQVVANGFASFVQGADGGISLISGTSFSSPTTAGAAALLWQAKPDKTATDIRSALINSADISIFGDFNVTPIDRGNGFLNLTNALSMLESNDDSGAEMPELPELGDRPTRVQSNIEKLDINVIEAENNQPYIQVVSLKPGEVSQIFIETEAETSSLTVEFSNYQASLPVEEQNQAFGDAFLVTLLDAPTSINVTLLDERIDGDTSFTIDKPQSGILRLALMGDWTNVGDVTTTVTISATEKELDDEFAEGRLADEESDFFDFRVRDQVTALNFELIWRADWGRYPPHDIDLILIDPAGEMYFDGATLDIPERVVISDPMPGTWTAIVTGFMLHGFEDKYELFITDQNNTRLLRR